MQILFTAMTLTVLWFYYIILNNDLIFCLLSFISMNSYWFSLKHPKRTLTVLLCSQTCQLASLFHVFSLEVHRGPWFSELGRNSGEGTWPHSRLTFTSPFSSGFSGPACLETPIFCRQRRGQWLCGLGWNLRTQVLIQALSLFCFLPGTAERTLLSLLEGLCALIPETSQASVLGVSFLPVLFPLQTGRFLLSQLS